MPELRSRTSVRVRYAETDQMGIVYYANYLVWMEVARVAYCREAGFEYRDMEREAGAFLTVTEARCRYQRPARFDDIVDVTCWVTESRSRAVSFAYLMHRGAELLAEGETMHMVTDRHGRVIRLPAPYRVFFPLMR